jgi:hypothetical protein
MLMINRELAEAHPDPRQQILADADAAVGVIRGNRWIGRTKFGQGLRDPIPGAYEDSWLSPRASRQKLIDAGVGGNSLVGTMETSLVAFAQGLSGDESARLETGEPDLFLAGVNTDGTVAVAHRVNSETLTELPDVDIRALQIAAAFVRASAQPPTPAR